MEGLRHVIYIIGMVIVIVSDPDPVNAADAPFTARSALESGRSFLNPASTRNEAPLSRELLASFRLQYVRRKL